MPTWLKITIVLTVNNLCGFAITKCVGPSMQPTIDGDFVLVNKFIYTILHKKPIKGEVVLLSPPNTFKIVCKRIHAIEGEEVQYVKDGNLIRQVVPPNHVWVLGDNYDNSIDSRDYGPVLNRNISGKVLLKLNNFQEIK